MPQKQRYSFPTLTVGTCYYPEHWDETLWPEDLDRMLDAGITVIRVAEFAWSLFERTEGVFTFDFFDRFLALCQEKGMKVIFGTPTATPPAWLTEKYPEVLNARRDGVLYRHGARRHYNYNSPVYREKTAIIMSQLAQHYGAHPAIIGWQIDNELNCETNEYYSEADSAAFRVFLREKYGTLDALNDAWGTSFWSETYTDWDQLYVPRPVVPNGINPHLHLDYLRFVSASTLSYCALQAEILRRYVTPGVFITTNGMFGHMDNHRMTDESLDLYTYDSYPNFAFSFGKERIDDFNDRWSSKSLTEVRSICPHFGVMEQQSGPGSWYSWAGAPSPRPGQMTLWAMQSVAHGADFVSFFRWRTCTFGTEIYWHGILDHDNQDNRRLDELRTFSGMMKKLAPLCGADVAAKVAIIKDMDNVFDAEIDQWHRACAKASEDGIFEGCQVTHTPCDVVYLRGGMTAAELAKYKVLFLPHAFILTPAQADLLTSWVEAGGTLLVGCRSAYKDEHGRCLMTVRPGLLRSLTGTEIHDFSFHSPAEPTPYAVWKDGTMLDTPVYNDVLTPDADTKVLARYVGAYYAGEAALTEHMYGAGRVLHLGSTFDRSNVKQILSYLNAAEPLSDIIAAPREIELVPREKDGQRWLFALNYQPKAMAVTLKKKVVDALTDAEEGSTVSIPAYGVKVWRI